MQILFGLSRIDKWRYVVDFKTFADTVKANVWKVIDLRVGTGSVRCITFNIVYKWEKRL